MDTERFNHWEDGFGLYDFHDLVARFSFKTPSSISFDIIENKNYVTGWVDIHHPIEDFYETRMRICIPEKYILLNEPVEKYNEHWHEKYIEKYDHNEMKCFCEKILESLGIDASKPREVHYVIKNLHIVMVNQDRPGTLE